MNWSFNDSPLYFKGNFDHRFGFRRPITLDTYYCKINIKFLDASKILNQVKL